MSLLDKYKDTKAEQAVITSLDKVKGRVGLYLRSGLQTTGTYLYNINDLRVGLSVIVTKVDNFYVILNRATSDAMHKSYSVPKTLNLSPTCTAEINEDPETLETNGSVTLTANIKPHTKYKWSIKEGGGYFTNVKNDSVTYNAPSNEDEVEITLSLEDGTFCDSITILVYSPICTSTIGYASQQMIVGTSQNLTVVNPVSGRTYHWEIISGGGSLSNDEGLSTTYTAPDSNPNCDLNPIIELTMEGAENVCDTLKIAVSAEELGNWLSWEFDEILHENCAQWYGPCVGRLETWCRKSYTCLGEFVTITDNESCLHSCDGTYDPENPCATTANLCLYDAMPVDGRTEHQKMSGCCPPQLL